MLPLTVNFTALSKDVTAILPQLLSVLLSANSQVGKKETISVLIYTIVDLFWEN
jgi:hypothetical protein